MFTRRDLVPVLLNVSLSALQATETYVGPLPSRSFAPVEPSALVADALVSQLLGGSLQAKAFSACQLLSIAERSPLSRLLGPESPGPKPEFLELRKMYSLSIPSSTDATAELQAPRPRLTAPEYVLHRFELSRLSSTTYRLRRPSGQTEVLNQNAAGYYVITVSAAEEQVLLIRPTESTLLVNWAAMPNKSLAEQFTSFGTEQAATIDLLATSPQHVLDPAVRKALRSIIHSRAATSLRPCAMLLLILSHYNYLHDLRG